MLCSLSNVTWPECGWGGCQMHELVTHEQVKKVYRKAVLHIHPDKVKKKNFLLILKKKNIFLI